MRKNRKTKNIIIATMVGLVCIFSIGYAAFSTNFTVSGKGKIIENPITIEELKAKVVTSGDGLYADSYEEGRYVYRGANPDNYINFNDEKYRIIAVESDGTLKIVKSETLGDRIFEEANTRTAAYCNGNSYGCNVWGSKTTMLDGSGNNITAMPTEIGGSALALPSEESQMAKYLNTDYYNTLSNEAKSQIDTHMWNVGILKNASGQILETDVEQEKAYKWRGNVGLINPSDYVKASTDESCTGAYAAFDNPSTCGGGNYLKIGLSYWTMLPYSSTDSNTVWSVSANGYLGNIYAGNRNEVRPTFYLKSGIKLSGKGTETNSYEIIQS